MLDALRLAHSAQSTKHLPTLGRPVVGGPFSLYDHTGKPVSDKDFRGKYMLIYFGFTNCPDICPTELNKMASIMNTLGAAMCAFTCFNPMRIDDGFLSDI